MKELFKKIWGPLVVTMVLLLFAEAIARLILRFSYNRDFDSTLIADNKYATSAGLHPNSSGLVWGKVFTTDAFGCRRTAVPYSPKKKKWLFIGDSVTEGVGVDDTSTFTSIAATHVDSLNVMNYSLIGYSDADYLNVLKTLLAKPDSSIERATIFFCLNDVYGSTKSNQLPVMAKQNVIGWVNGWLQNNYATYKLVKLLVYQNADRYYRYDCQFYEPGNANFIASMDYLRQCDSLCRAAGIKMNVVMLPYRSQLTNTDANQPQKMVEQYCNNQHIAFSNPLDFCRRPGAAKDKYLFADEIHFSAEGHKMIASYIVSH